MCEYFSAPRPLSEHEGVKYSNPLTDHQKQQQLLPLPRVRGHRLYVYAAAVRAHFFDCMRTFSDHINTSSVKNQHNKKKNTHSQHRQQQQQNCPRAITAIRYSNQLNRTRYLYHYTSTRYSTSKKIIKRIYNIIILYLYG